MEHKTSIKSSESTNKKSKTQKRVSFAVKPHHQNFARKSTVSHKNIYHRRIRSRKCMQLKLTKINIDGYTLPSKCISESDDLSTCARLLPVKEVLSSKNVRVVDMQDSNTINPLPQLNAGINECNFDFPAALSSKLKLLKKVKKKHHLKKHHLRHKEKKIRKTKLSRIGEAKQAGTFLSNSVKERAEAMCDEDSILSQCGEGSASGFEENSTISSMDAEYELKLKETIKKFASEIHTKKQ